MTVNKNREGNALCVSVVGRLDTVTAPELEASLKEEFEGLADLTIDLGELEYISSAGLRVLLLAQKTMSKQGKMVVRNVNETVKEIFDVTGFSDILTVE